MLRNSDRLFSASSSDSSVRSNASQDGEDVLETAVEAAVLWLAAAWELVTDAYGLVMVDSAICESFVAAVRGDSECELVEEL